jgi:hypothetical protein
MYHVTGNNRPLKTHDKPLHWISLVEDIKNPPFKEVDTFLAATSSTKSGFLDRRIVNNRVEISALYWLIVVVFWVNDFNWYY